MNYITTSLSGSTGTTVCFTAFHHPKFSIQIFMGNGTDASYIQTLTPKRSSLEVEFMADIHPIFQILTGPHLQTLTYDLDLRT